MKTALLLAALLIAASSAFAQNTGETSEFWLTFYNSCCDEYVTVHGTAEVFASGNKFSEVQALRVKISGATGYCEETPSNGPYDQRGNISLRLNQNNGYVTTARFTMVNDNGCSFTVNAVLEWHSGESGLTPTLVSYELICK